jgi:hypothetical protein
MANKFQFTTEDMMKGKVVTEPTWTVLECSRVQSAPSRKQDSINMLVDFRVLEGQYKGLEIRQVVSEKFKMPGILMAKAMFPEIEITAGTELDFDTFVGLKVKSLIGFRLDPTDPSRKYNEIKEYAPIS